MNRNVPQFHVAGRSRPELGVLERTPNTGKDYLFEMVTLFPSSLVKVTVNFSL